MLKKKERKSCMISEDVDYSARVIWKAFVKCFFHFWRLTDPVAIVKKSQDILKFRFGVQWK